MAFLVAPRQHSMQPVPNATAPLFTALATVPPTPAEGPIAIAQTVGAFGMIVALIGLLIPTIFYLVWIAVGLMALRYLRRELKRP